MSNLVKQYCMLAWNLRPKQHHDKPIDNLRESLRLAMSFGSYKQKYTKPEPTIWINRNEEHYKVLISVPDMISVPLDIDVECGKEEFIEQLYPAVIERLKDYATHLKETKHESRS